jgi:hypothetical protein
MRKDNLIKAILIFSGSFYIITSLALLFIPQWFFDNVGGFPPFNRHFMGDAGAFLIAIGVGLIVGARNPTAHSTAILVGWLSTLVHVANHAYDDFIATGQFVANHFIMQTLPLLIIGLALLWVWIEVRRTHGMASAG